MQNHSDGDGSHWTLAKIVCDEEREENKVRKGKEPMICEALYFDPFGIDMPKEVEEFLKPFKPIPYNNRQIQNINSEVCGYYCLYCDYVLEHKQYGETYKEDFNRFLNLWSDDTTKNEKLLKKFMLPL